MFNSDTNITKNSKQNTEAGFLCIENSENGLPCSSLPSYRDYIYSRPILLAMTILTTSLKSSNVMKAQLLPYSVVIKITLVMLDKHGFKYALDMFTCVSLILVTRDCGFQSPKIFHISLEGSSSSFRAYGI